MKNDNVSNNFYLSIADKSFGFRHLQMACAQVGTIIAMPVSGVLAETSIGWKLIFYAMSGLLFFNAIIWYFFAASSPADHRMIYKEERQYIEDALNSSGSPKVMRIPWRHILTSVPLYGIMAAHIGTAISFVLFFVDMPTYLEKGLKISLKSVTSNEKVHPTIETDNVQN
ncbi:hypothetical protein ACJJTC_005324 [Scirpophaga incertulas]